MTARTRTVLVLVGALALAGCSVFGPEPPVGNFTISEEPPPELNVTDLRVQVSYGGCAVAEFDLEQTVSRGRAVLRLRRTTPEGPCSMLLTQWLEFSLAASVRAAAEVRLVGPDRSIRLR